MIITSLEDVNMNNITNLEWVQSMSKDELAKFLANLLLDIFDFDEGTEWVKQWLDLPKGEKMPPI
jgi:hypothetical protein